MSLLIIRVDSVKALILVVSNRDVCAWICFSCPLSKLPFFFIMLCLVSETREEKIIKIQSLSSNFDWCVLCFFFISKILSTK